MSDRKTADGLVANADKILNKCGMFSKMFGNTSNLENAAESLNKAGSQYKVVKLWRESGDAYLREAELYSGELNDKLNAATAYSEAGNSYRKIEHKKAIECYEKAITVYIDMGRLTIAARYYAICAEIYEKDIVDIPKAMENYEKAAELYRGEESVASANKYLLKVAEFSALDEKYKKAIDIYELIAESYLTNNLMKYSVKDYYFKASVVALCYDLLEAQRSLDIYCQKCPSFLNSREDQLVREIIRSIEEADTKIFDDAIQKFDHVSRMDDWCVKLLLRLKKTMDGFIDIT